MKEYRIKKAPLPQDVPADSPLWDNAPAVAIDSFTWDDGTGYRPNTQAKLLYTNEGISVRFETDETPLKAVWRHNNEPVWCDSCVEFFIQPDEADARYLNFEMNPAGALLLGLGTQSEGRQELDFDVSLFRIDAQVKDGIWTHRLYVPFSFLKQYFAQVSPRFRGNLFKCGDETEHPHFGSWNPVIWPQPQFHLSQCFGSFVLEQE